MKYRAILFDLDGTLLPMDLYRFTDEYFKLLAQKLAPLGMEQDALIAAVWTGTRAMVKNDGARTNAAVFWDAFADATGQDAENFRAASDLFYKTDFDRARQFAGENPLAKEAVRLAHLRAEKVACTTNPVFPLDGQLTRLRWLGLGQEDFDLITAYEEGRFCKPNPKYFQQVMQTLGVQPEECLMIGNDEGEDMAPAAGLGMDCYLVTDCAIRRPGCTWTGKQGTFQELIRFLG